MPRMWESAGLGLASVVFVAVAGYWSATAHPGPDARIDPWQRGMDRVAELGLADSPQARESAERAAALFEQRTSPGQGRPGASLAEFEEAVAMAVFHASGAASAVGPRAGD